VHGIYKVYVVTYIKYTVQTVSFLTCIFGNIFRRDAVPALK